MLVLGQQVRHRSLPAVGLLVLLSVRVCSRKYKTNLENKTLKKMHLSSPMFFLVPDYDYEMLMFEETEADYWYTETLVLLN